MDPDDPQNQGTDPQIEVDQPTSKIIAEIICSEIQNSFKENSDYYRLCERCENQYSQLSIWAQENVVPDTPWYGAADYFVPMTEWIIDALHARIMNTLFSQEPYMEAKGTKSEWVEKENGVTEFVDQVFREKIRVYENTRFFFKQMIKLPLAVLKYDRVHEFEPMLVKDKALKFTHPETEEAQYILPDDPDQTAKAAELLSNGYVEGGSEEVWVQEDRPIIDGPHMRYIRPNDHVFSPFAYPGNRIYWEGDRIWLTLHDMAMRAKQGSFRQETVDKIRRTANPQMSGTTSQDAIKTRSKLYEAFHWHGRLPFNSQNQIDFRDPDSIEQEVHCVVAFKEKELLSVRHWSHSRLPHPDRVYLYGRYEETQGFLGRSMCEKLYQSQQYLNQFYNSSMDNAMISMMKVFQKKKSLTGEDLEKPEIYPGAFIEVDQINDVQVLNMGDLKAISKDVENSIMGFAERISNISTPQTGVVRREGGQKTKGEIDATIYEGNIGMDNFVKRCHEILREICTWTVGYYHDHMPPDFERRLRDDNGNQIFPTEENIARFQEEGVKPYWEADDIAGQFNWKWLGTTINSSMERNIAISNDLMDRYMDKPMIQGSLMATWEILKRGLIARGDKNWQTILPPREAVVAEMQRKAERDKVQQMQNAGQRIRDAIQGQIAPAPGPSPESGPPAGSNGNLAALGRG